LAGDSTLATTTARAVPCDRQIRHDPSPDLARRHAGMCTLDPRNGMNDRTVAIDRRLDRTVGVDSSSRHMIATISWGRSWW